MRKGRPLTTYAVILVGGKGKRLRPLSTASRPKAFLPVTKGRKTMFAATAGRMKRLVGPRNIIAVANKAHARLVKRDFPGIAGRNLILESVSKNTAPALALACRAILKREEDAVMAVVPTDQYITGEKRYAASFKEAIDFAAKPKGALVVLGVRPRQPSAEFGYIRVSARRVPGWNNIYKVISFVEKPDKKKAARYLANGSYLWHTGAFIFRASALRAAFRKYAPAVYRSDWSRIPDISLDYAVMEKADNVYCAAGGYGWSDMGTFASLKEILKREGRRFLESGSRIKKIL